MTSKNQLPFLKQKLCKILKNNPKLTKKLKNLKTSQIDFLFASPNERKG
jgi:hypothetical protein